jgi:hypothetical protein
MRLTYLAPRTSVVPTGALIGSLAGVLLVCVLSGGGPAAAAQPGDDDSAQQRVAESLDAMGNLPWYDAEQDAVRPVEVAPRLQDSANRDSRWTPKPKEPRTRTARGTATAKPRPTIWSSVPQLASWLLLAVVIIGITALLVWVFMRAESPEQIEVQRTAEGAAPSPTAEEIAKLEHLPLEMQRGAGDFLERADQLRAAGRIDAALVYLFGHRLLQLDRRHWIRLARGKTNRQYLRELAGRPELREPLRQTIDLFEMSFFGRYPVSEGQYDALRGRQGEFDLAVAAEREAA